MKLCPRVIVHANRNHAGWETSSPDFNSIQSLTFSVNWNLNESQIKISSSQGEQTWLVYFFSKIQVLGQTPCNFCLHSLTLWKRNKLPVYRKALVKGYNNFIARTDAKVNTIWAYLCISAGLTTLSHPAIGFSLTGTPNVLDAMEWPVTVLLTRWPYHHFNDHYLNLCFIICLQCSCCHI